MKLFMNIVSTKMTNTATTNVTKNHHSKEVRDSYILRAVLLAILLLLIIIIICYHHSKHSPKQGINAQTI